MGPLHAPGRLLSPWSGVSRQCPAHGLSSLPVGGVRAAPSVDRPPVPAVQLMACLGGGSPRTDLTCSRPA